LPVIEHKKGKYTYKKKEIAKEKRENRYAKMGNSQFGSVCASFGSFSFPSQSV